MTRINSDTMRLLGGSESGDLFTVDAGMVKNMILSTKEDGVTRFFRLDHPEVTGKFLKLKFVRYASHDVGMVMTWNDNMGEVKSGYFAPMYGTLAEYLNFVVRQVSCSVKVVSGMGGVFVISGSEFKNAYDNGRYGGVRFGLDTVLSPSVQSWLNVDLREERYYYDE